jgi:sugar phosphate isomerase/epimerase
VAAGPRLRPRTSTRERVEGTARAFATAAARAADVGVRLAVENHADLTADELAEVVERVDSPASGCASTRRTRCVSATSRQRRPSGSRPGS